MRQFAARPCRAAGSRPTSSRVLDELGYRGVLHQPARLVAPRRPAARDARASRCGAGMQPEDFAAIADGAPRALWGLQAVEAAKNAAKACLGHGGWQRLRAPLLALRERL